MKKNIKLLVFSAMAFLLSFSIFAGANDEYLHREKHDWKKSFYGEETYTANVVFFKAWDDVKDSIPLVMEKSQDNGKNYMASDYKLRVNKLGEKYIIFYFNPVAHTVKGYRFSRNGKLDNIYYNEQCPINFLYSQDVFDFKNELYMFDYDAKLGVKLTENNETYCIDKKNFEEKYDIYDIYGLKDVIKNRKELYYGIYDRKSPDLLIAKIDSREMEEGHLTYPYLLGTDKQLNVYIIMEIFRKNEREKETHLYVIYKLSKDGKMLAKIYPELNDFLQPYSTAHDNKEKLFTNDEFGNIYQLWLNEKTIKIIEWSTAK